MYLSSKDPLYEDSRAWPFYHLQPSYSNFHHQKTALHLQHLIDVHWETVTCLMIHLFHIFLAFYTHIILIISFWALSGSSKRLKLKSTIWCLNNCCYYYNHSSARLGFSTSLSLPLLFSISMLSQPFSRFFSLFDFDLLLCFFKKRTVPFSTLRLSYF